MLFKDRQDAGRYLAGLLHEYEGQKNTIVLALPRGGVPVGYEVATSLNLPLDVFIVRKLGVPGQEELAMGAIASGGIRVLNEDVILQLRIPDSAIAVIAVQEERELQRREKLYRKDLPALNVSGKSIILVDDGLATGASMRAAALALRQLVSDTVIVAVPVAAASTCLELQSLVDRIVCAKTPEPFYGVGQWYDEFSQNTDQQVIELLENSNHEQPSTFR